MTPLTATADTQTIVPDLRRQLDDHQHNCTQCGVCVAECHFLTRYGDPLQQASDYNHGSPGLLTRAFECHLCGLCTQVCPDGLDPARMFLEMRREASAHGLSDLPEHRGLRKYERTGNSRAYSWYALPDNCDTIFFPGCALVGSRAETTNRVFEYLQQLIPALGIVLDCCNKPSHDLGDHGHFATMFEELRNYLTTHGIKQVLVACPNCSSVFTQYAPELTTRTIYEALAEHPPAPALAEATKKTLVTVHDPCVTRSDATVQDAVRQLLLRAGFKVMEMPHSRELTICCGEGGGTSCLVPEQSQQWIDQRLDEAQGKPIVSYCAGCTNSFSGKTTTGHVLDLIFQPQTALTAKHKVTKAPLTYLRRRQFKKTLQRQFPAAITRERTFVPPTAGQAKSIIGKLSHYALASLILMLPGCIAFIVFSSSLLDLFQGKISPTFLIGLFLIAIVSLIPVIYQKIRSRSKPAPPQPSCSN